MRLGSELSQWLCSGRQLGILPRQPRNGLVVIILTRKVVQKVARAQVTWQQAFSFTQIQRRRGRLTAALLNCREISLYHSVTQRWFDYSDWKNLSNHSSYTINSLHTVAYTQFTTFRNRGLLHGPNTLELLTSG